MKKPSSTSLPLNQLPLLLEHFKGMSSPGMTDFQFLLSSDNDPLKLYILLPHMHSYKNLTQKPTNLFKFWRFKEFLHSQI